MKKLTNEQTEELSQLALLSDENIDISDISEQTNWENAVVGQFYSKHKPKTSIDISSEESSELQRRLNAHQADPSSGIPWEQVRAALFKEQY
jgi:putative addiction module component (TIGR02574 family)